MELCYILKATEALVGFLAGERLHMTDTAEAFGSEWGTDWCDQSTE